MAQLLNVSIDVTKINKDKLIKGKKGTYLNLTIAVNDEEDKFGNNVSAWIAQEQQEREQKAPKTYLGNGKVFWSNNGTAQPQNNGGGTAQGSPVPDDDDDLPFAPVI